MRSIRMLLCFTVMLATAPLTSWAEDGASPANGAAIEQAEGKASAESAASGCPGAVDGKCCGACETRARISKGAAEKQGGCPCQRARQARQAQREKE